MGHKICAMQVIPNLGIGGAETFVTEMMFNFPTDTKSVLVSLYKPNGTILENRLKDGNIDVIYLDKKKGADFHLVRELRKVIKRYRPDVINTHLYALTYVVLATRFMRKKPIVFHTVHNIAKMETTERKQKLYYWYFHHLHIYPIGISKLITQSIESRYKLKNVVTIDNGIDYQRFKGNDDYQNREYDFIHIGRFTYQKNHELLLRAFKRVVEKRPSHLYLVGQGELFKDMQALVQELEIEDNVTFLGLRSDVDKLLKSSKICVLPSHFEGNPLSLLEAMSSGCVVIATSVGGVSDILIDGKNGYLCAKEEKALAELMIHCLDDESKMKEISIHNIEYAQKFDISEVAKNYNSTYQSYLDKKKKSRHKK